MAVVAVSQRQTQVLLHLPSIRDLAQQQGKEQVNVMEANQQKSENSKHSSDLKILTATKAEEGQVSKRRKCRVQMDSRSELPQGYRCERGLPDGGTPWPSTSELLFEFSLAE